MNRALLAGLLLLAIASRTSAAVLEVPADQSTVSGIGFVSGWKCPPNDDIVAVIDHGVPIPMATGIRRGDTTAACGNDGTNGYIAQLNFALLGDGEHQISVREGGVEFASGTFTVVTFGVPFMRGIAGTYILDDFPNRGQTTTVAWNEGTQSFVIVGTTGSAPATPSPSPRPTARPTSAPTPRPTAKPTPRPTPRPTSPPPACCKVCSTGKACGDTCISRSNTCHVGPGCACNG